VIDKGQLYTDLTGRFHQRSSKSNWYVMVVYSFDCNYIKSVAMKSKSVSEWLNFFGGIFQELTSRGLKPNIKTIDNDASSALKSYFTENDMPYQLLPPHCHRCNAAERAIRTFKEHFVAGLSSVDPDFPMYLWIRLLPQEEITFNSLRTSRLHPQLSVVDHFHDLFYRTKQRLPHQGAKSLHIKNLHKGELGTLMASQATR
jgi:hypothetical protein